MEDWKRHSVINVKNAKLKLVHTGGDAGRVGKTVHSWLGLVTSCNEGTCSIAVEDGVARPHS